LCCERLLSASNDFKPLRAATVHPMQHGRNIANQDLLSSSQQFQASRIPHQRTKIERDSGMKFVETNGFTDLGVGARLWRHESGTYVKFMHAGAELFA
jgi:hypothetical protein